jgi:hypothetical protein
VPEAPLQRQEIIETMEENSLDDLVFREHSSLKFFTNFPCKCPFCFAIRACEQSCDGCV